MKMLSRRAALACGGLAAAGFARPARATANRLAAPSGKVVLSISGQLGVTNAPDAAQFDMAMLEALGVESFSTATPWFTGKVTFEGVPMARLLEHVGARGTAVTALALNDYSTEIPMEDFTRHRVLLASKRDGAYMPVKDKGPLFIVYPYDSDPMLSHQRFYSRSAWQLARLIVK